MPPNQLDPQAVALAKAIRKAESKGDFNAKGASGEWGAYQFTPATWDAYSREFGVNAAFGSATPDQQNEVAYRKIKQWKDAGYNVGEIASMWNAGPGKKDAYLEGHKGVNSLGVAYDTGAYAEKVAKAYQRLKGETVLAQQDVPMQGAEPEKTTLLGDAGNALSESGMKMATAVGDTFAGNINPISGLIRVAGSLGSGLTGLVDAGLKHTPVVNKVYEGANELVGKFAEGVASTDAGQAGIQKYQEFAQAHPELAGNISAGVDVVSAIPAFKGVKMATNKLGDAKDALLYGKSDAVVDAVSPHLTPKDMASAIATRGTTKKGLLGEVHLNPDPYAVKVGDAVKALVPRFNPNDDLLKNIAEVQTVVTKTNKELKQRVAELGANRIYSIKELGANLRNLDVPDVIAAEPYLLNLHNRLVGHALRIAREKGGKVPKLLDARQAFDQLVKRQYPNIYNNLDRTSPLRETVKQIRDAMTDFTVKNLPEDALLKETLKNEHLLITAIESMAEKASKSATREVGTNALGRFGKRHPVTKGLLKAGGQAALQGAGIGGVMKILD